MAARRPPQLCFDMRSILVAMVFCVACASAAHAQRDPRAEKLVSGWIDASGGAGIWDKVRDLRFTITTVWYDSTGNIVRQRPRFVTIDKRRSPYRVRIERTEPEGRYVQVWNNIPRASLNGRMLPDTARAVREVEYVAGDLTYWIGLPWKLRDHGVHLSYAEEGGVPVVHVTFGAGIGLHDGDRYWYYWRDPASPFPTEVHYIEQGKTERMQVMFSERARINRVSVFTRRTIKNAQGLLLRALVISDVVVNRDVSESLFHLN